MFCSLGFRFQYPRLKFLSRCLRTRIRDSPPLRFTHVKPRHVTHSSREVAKTFSEKVNLVKLFIKNLKTAGFRALIVHRRHNTLAMLISDFELFYKHKTAIHRAFKNKFIHVMSIIQYNRLILEIGYQEAIRVDIPVIETNFTAITGKDSCQEYLRIYQQLNIYGLDVPSHLVNNCTRVSGICDITPRRK